MKRTVFLLLVLMTCAASSWPKQINITTPTTTLLLDATEGEPLIISHYGSALKPDDVSSLAEGQAMNLHAYPAFGLRPQTPYAIAATFHDGNMTLDLRVADTCEEKTPYGTRHYITLRDRHYPLVVKICYEQFDDVDVIETWTEITNAGKDPVELRRFASGYLPIRYGDTWVSTLHGSWADEANVVERQLGPGLFTISNHDGLRNSQNSHPEIMISLDGKPNEKSGRTIGAALCYSGDYELSIDTEADSYHHLTAGISPANSARRLAKKETFTTPRLALTFSPDGLGGASRNFHRWARKYKIAGGTKQREIVLNSWEGVYFDVNEAGMEKMMNEFAELGGELFVMDDGWFGSEEYPRTNDRQGLGDWMVDKRKLPGGLTYLTEAARKNGLKFGIWIEPESVNKRSRFYEKYPDRIVKAQHRDTVTGRGGTQLVLDLTRDDVQDFIVNMVDTLLENNPQISYIKWDANMALPEYGSQNLAREKQSHLVTDFHTGLENVLKRIRTKHPDVVMQACASGGGRVNYGLMPYFNEFWASDNTDARQRVDIQWGTSYFFPACAMAAHISASPNHQTGRSLPLKYRTDVAMSGRLGLELQPSTMTDEEKEHTRKAISEYKRIRDILNEGDLYRIDSPLSNEQRASLLHVTEAKDRAVYFQWKLKSEYGEKTRASLMDGLAPDAIYKVTELNCWREKPLEIEGKCFSGRYLMETGLMLPASPYGNLEGENTSFVLLLEKL